MNIFQKTGTFLVRFTGAAMIMVSILGFIYLAVLAFLGKAGTIPSERIVTSGIWLVTGIILIVMAPLFGRLLGRDLD